MAVNRAVLVLAASSAANVYTASDPVEVPRGGDLCGATIAIANDGFNGATVEAKLQGAVVENGGDPSDAGVVWYDVDDGAVTATADDPGQQLGGTDKLLSLLPYTHLRLTASTSAGGPPTGAGTYSALVNVQTQE